MNTYLLKTSRGYTKLQGNVRIISSTMQWLKKKFSQQMKDVLEKFWWHLTHQFLLKILAQENLSVNSHHMRHLKKIRSSYFGDTIPTTTTPQSSTLPPPEKEYICFQIEVECAYSSKCGKSRALIKVLKWIFDIDSFDKQFIFIKGLLQSKQPKNTWFPLGLTNH